MPDWSIKFIPIKNPTPDRRANFVLDAPGDPPGPFDVFQGDVVSWNNTTGDQHQPAVYKPVPAGNPPAGTPDPIGGLMQPHKSSPGYAVSAAPGMVIHFCCTQHKGEVGQMEVTTPGQPPGPPPSV
jgi:hypothetical protein